MGMLDQLLAAAQPGQFPAFAPENAEAAAVAEAAEAAARRQRRGVKHWAAPLAEGSEIPGLGTMGSAGMLAPALFGAPEPSSGFASTAGSSLPPSTNDPGSSEPVVFAEGVPLPRPRPEAAPKAETDDVSGAQRAPGLPLSIAPPVQAQPQAQPQGGGQQGQAESGGIGGILSSLLQPANAPLLLSLAGGFAGAPSIGTGMRRAFTGATPAAMQSMQMGKQQASQGATYKALLARGVPQAEALAAVLDPNLMKATAAKYFDTKALSPTKYTDAFGTEHQGSFDPNTGKHFDAAGKPRAAAGEDTGGMGAIGNIDSSLVGEDYINQPGMPAEFKAAVKAYVRGDLIPSGNPRKGFTQAVKMAAQKYGEDIGVPVSDQKFAERRQFRTEMASGKAGVGAQRTSLRQGLEHLEGVAKSAEELGNWDAGITWLSTPINKLRGVRTDQAAKVVGMQNKVQQFAGEMGKFFSGSQGGGVHEREETRKKFDAVSTPQELAAAIKSSMELLHGGLHARQQQRDSLFGNSSDPSLEFLGPDDRKRVDRIEQLVKKLRGEGGGAKAAPAGKTTGGVPWSIVQ